MYYTENVSRDRLTRSGAFASDGHVGTKPDTVVNTVSPPEGISKTARNTQYEDMEALSFKDIGAWTGKDLEKVFAVIRDALPYVMSDQYKVPFLTELKAYLTNGVPFKISLLTYLHLSKDQEYIPDTAVVTKPVLSNHRSAGQQLVKLPLSDILTIARLLSKYC